MEELRHNPETIVSSSVWQEAESCMWCYLCMCGGSVLDSQLGRQTSSPVWHLNIVSSLRGWKLTSDQHINTCIFIRGGTRGVSYILSVIYTKYCRSPITTEMAASTPLLWYCVKFLCVSIETLKVFPTWHVILSLLSSEHKHLLAFSSSLFFSSSTSCSTFALIGCVSPLEVSNGSECGDVRRLCHDEANLWCLLQTCIPNLIALNHHSWST